MELPRRRLISPCQAERASFPHILPGLLKETTVQTQAMHAHTCTHTCTHTDHTHAHVCTHVKMHTDHMCAHVHTCARSCTHTRACMHTTHACLYPQAHEALSTAVSSVPVCTANPQGLEEGNMHRDQSSLPTTAGTSHDNHGTVAFGAGLN